MFADAPTTASGTSVTTVVVAVLLAAIPGVIAGYWSLQQRREDRRSKQDENATTFGTTMAQTAFETLSGQVTMLLNEQTKWSTDREMWSRDREVWNQDRQIWRTDKARLIAKITTLIDQLTLTNSYLETLLVTLDMHDINRPMPPTGWTDEVPAVYDT